MATATYTIEYDELSETYDILDADRNLQEACNTLAEAAAEVARMVAEEEVETIGNVLIDMVNDAINAGDLAALRRMYGRLKA